MEAKSVDPRDVDGEVDAPRYRVYFARPHPSSDASEHVKLVVIAVCVLLLGVACESGSPDNQAERPAPSDSASASECVAPHPTKVQGVRLEGFCPESDPLRVGESRRMIVSAVHESPCWDPPDFAGSFWRTHTHLAPKSMSALHGGVSGRMTLVAKDAAVFRGPAVEVRESLDEPFERIPPKGGFVLRFHRIDSGILRANCA